MQNDTVRTPRTSMRRPVLIALGAVCFLALGGGLFAKMRYESSVREQIEHALATLPEPVKASAENIEVSFFSRSVTMRNITGSVDSTTGPQPFSIKFASVSGLNRDAFKQDAGVAKWADTVKLNDLAFTGPSMQANVASYSLQGVSGNFPLLLAESAAVLPVLLSLEKAEPLSDDDARALLGNTARLLKAYETVHVKNASITDYSYSATVDGTPIRMSMGSMETNDYSIRGVGRTALRGLSVASGDAFAAAFDTLSLERGTFPSLVPFLEQAASGAPPALSLYGIFHNQPFELTKLHSTKLAVAAPEDRAAPYFTLDDALFSATSMPTGDNTLDLSFTGLSMRGNIVADGTDLPASALPLLPDPVVLEGALTTALTAKDRGTFDFLIKQARLKGPGLGEFDLDLDLKNVNPTSLFMGMPGTTALASLNLALTDAGMTEILFTTRADATGASAGEERARAVAQFSASDSTASGSEVPDGSVQKILNDALAAFLKKPGGRLQLSLRPQTPLTSNSLGPLQGLDPQSIGLTVSATPGE